MQPLPGLMSSLRGANRGLRSIRAQAIRQDGRDQSNCGERVSRHDLAFTGSGPVDIVAIGRASAPFPTLNC